MVHEKLFPYHLKISKVCDDLKDDARISQIWALAGAMVTRAQLLLSEKLHGDKSDHEFSPLSMATVRDVEVRITVMILLTRY